jgi:hypothetical protein
MVEFYKLPKDVSLMEDLFAWLEKNQYIIQVKTYKKDFEIEGNDILTSDCQILGVFCRKRGDVVKLFKK